MEGALDLFAMVAALNDEDDDVEVDREAALAERKQLEEKMQVWKSIREEVEGNVRRENGEDLAVEKFVEAFLTTETPVLLLGCAEKWPSAKWDIHEWVARFGDLDCALYTGQQFPLREYVSYAEGRGEEDESPLYLFEDLSQIESTEPKHALLGTYSVPKFFKEDLFELVDVRASEEMYKSRPRFRWLLVGPARSGTQIHVDPIGTSAWNTLLIGHKRWVLVPPSISEAQRRLLLGPPDKKLTVGQWFIEILPSLEGIPIFEFTQQPGETIFVPAGWWHIVLNLDLTLAVTQNFASGHRAEQVATAMRRQTPSLFKSTWFTEMRVRYPHISFCESNLPKNFLEGQDHRLIRKFSDSKHQWSEYDQTWLDLVASRYDRFAEEFIANYSQQIANKRTRSISIPRVIHHVWLGGGDIPKKNELLGTWKRFHSKEQGWEIRLWNERSLANLLDIVNKSAFEGAQNFGEKSDILRYEILAKYGGVYIDIDFQCTASLEPLVQLMECAGYTFAAGLANNGTIEVSNGIMISTKSSNVVHTLLDEIQSKNNAETLTPEYFSEKHTHERTGAGLLTRILIRDMEKIFPDALVFPSLVFNPAPENQSEAEDFAAIVEQDRKQLPLSTLAIHHYLRSWC